MTRGSRPAPGTGAGAGALGRGGDRTARSLSVLDPAPVGKGSSPAAVLQASLVLAREAEPLGCARCRTDADEPMVTTMTLGPTARLRSYRLVAEAVGLTPRDAAPRPC